jgi:hypothetical protein
MKKKRNRPRYDFHQSQFYALRSRAGLATLLGLSSPRQLRELIHVKPFSYRTFVDDGRHIQAPTGPLLRVHKRVAALLRRIFVPDYVHSQVGRSYVTNARAHIGTEPTIKTDVSGYFPNTRSESVRLFFRETMCCSVDVAWLLAELLCFEGFVPTGSPLSNELAFFANKRVMDQIDALARSNDCRMTLLVDDITVSGRAASLKMLNGIKLKLRSAGHDANRSERKTRSYGTGQRKHITGVVVSSNATKLPNKRHKEMYEAYRRLEAATTKKERSQAWRRLKGRICEATSVDPNSVNMKFTNTGRPRRAPDVVLAPALIVLAPALKEAA